MNDNNNNKNLYYLEDLSDYKVSDGDKDARGWEVRDRNDRVLGKVDNFIVNKRTEKVVYMDVEVDDSVIEAKAEPYHRTGDSSAKKFVNKNDENHVILPVGMARLNTDEEYVMTDEIDFQTFAETRRMQKGQAIERDYEVIVLDSYTRDDDDISYREYDVNDDAFYGNERFTTTN